MYHLSYTQLLTDLHRAYDDARRHKGRKEYVQRFERHLEENLIALCDELWSRTYRPKPSICFIINDPKKREVFAANFRDRIVHHLYYNYTHRMYERTFIADSYSCIKGRGTHYGISRLTRHIRQESDSYRRPCYVLKLDVRGYFMHINRQILLGLCLDTLARMSRHRVMGHRPERWSDVVDMDFVNYLTREIVLLDPTQNCRRVGVESDWDDLPHDKSLFCSSPGCGLPIGNLTSQLFSNVYMNALDQYMKRTLGIRHYGRYVDDFYVVGSNRRRLECLVAQVRRFLHDTLALTLHDGKIVLCSVRRGVEFLGAFVLPFRQYVCRRVLHRVRRKVLQIPLEDDALAIQSRLNSFLGIMGHYRSWHLQCALFLSLPNVWRYGVFVVRSSGLLYKQKTLA